MKINSPSENKPQVIDPSYDDMKYSWAFEGYEQQKSEAIGILLSHKPKKIREVFIRLIRPSIQASVLIKREDFDQFLRRIILTAASGVIDEGMGTIKSHSLLVKKIKEEGMSGSMVGLSLFSLGFSVDALDILAERIAQSVRNAFDRKHDAELEELSKQFSGQFFGPKKQYFLPPMHSQREKEAEYRRRLQQGEKPSDGLNEEMWRKNAQANKNAAAALGCLPVLGDTLLLVMAVGGASFLRYVIESGKGLRFTLIYLFSYVPLMLGLLFMTSGRSTDAIPLFVFIAWRFLLIRHYF